MKKIILKFLSIIIVSSLIGCSSSRSTDSNQKELAVKPKVPEVSMEQNFGADMVRLDYASDETIIFHGSFGLFVYDIKESKIIRGIDLKEINCNFTQGDNYCDVNVSKDGTVVQLHNVSSEDMYVYNIVDNSLVKSNYKPMENSFKLILTPEDIMTNSYAYSSQCVKFDNGDLGYLVSEDFTLGTLKYIRNNKIYSILNI